MIYAISKNVSLLAGKIESGTGLFAGSLSIGLFLLAGAMLYVQPSFEVAFHGIQFAALSESPFDFSVDTPVRYRILAPVLGYMFFLRGDLFFILPLIFTWFLISAVYYQYRKKNFAPVEAFLLSCFIAFSCVILLPLVGPGYTDTVTFFFLFLSFAKIKNPAFSALFFALAFLNHECSLFLLPGLILYSFIENKMDWKTLTKTIFLFLLACIPHALYRLYVNSHVSVLYSTGFYFSKENILFSLKHLVVFFPGSIFYSFKLLWFFPLYLAHISFREKKFSQLAVVTVIVLAVFSQLIIAYDYTRMILFAFPAILIAAEEVRKKWGSSRFIKISVALILCNFIIVQYYFSYNGAVPMFPWILNKASMLLGNPLVN